MSIEVEKSGTVRTGCRPPADLRLGCSLQRRQMRGPELVEKVLHGGQAVRADDEQMPGALTVLGYEASAAKDTQVVGDDLLGHPQLQRDLTNRPGPIANFRQYPPPRGVGKRPQRPLDRSALARHPRNSNTGLYKCQLDRLNQRLFSSLSRRRRISSWFTLIACRAVSVLWSASARAS
jgi:hypothetical protein